jgi:hypothetical protein
MTFAAIKIRNKMAKIDENSGKEDSSPFPKKNP